MGSDKRDSFGEVSLQLLRRAVLDVISGDRQLPRLRRLPVRPGHPLASYKASHRAPARLLRTAPDRETRLAKALQRSRPRPLDYSEAPPGPARALRLRVVRPPGRSDDQYPRCTAAVRTG